MKNQKKNKKIQIEIPDKKKYDFMKKSVYGGRCNAIKKEYISNAKFDNMKSLLILMILFLMLMLVVYILLLWQVLNMYM